MPSVVSPSTSLHRGLIGRDVECVLNRTWLVIRPLSNAIELIILRATNRLSASMYRAMEILVCSGTAAELIGSVRPANFE